MIETLSLCNAFERPGKKHLFSEKTLLHNPINEKNSI